MSIISERLTKLGHTERSGFGFGARAASIKTPVILVGVTIDKPGDAKGVNADLFVLTTGKKGASQKIGLKDTELWGVLVAGGTGKEIDAAIEAGADFVVSEGESAPGAALRDDESGKGFVVGTDVSEDRSKAIDAGPFDFLILDGTAIEFPLSVGAVLDIQENLFGIRTIYSYECPIFLIRKTSSYFVILEFPLLCTTRRQQMLRI